MTDKYKIRLTDKFINQLINTPETGMGYHKVDIILKNGVVLKNQTVLNCSELILADTIRIKVEDIQKINVEFKSDK